MILSGGLMRIVVQFCVCVCWWLGLGKKENQCLNSSSWWIIDKEYGIGSQVFISPHVGRVAVQAFPVMGSERKEGANSITDTLNEIVLWGSEIHCPLFLSHREFLDSHSHLRDLIDYHKISLYILASWFVSFGVNNRYGQSQQRRAFKVPVRHHEVAVWFCWRRLDTHLSDEQPLRWS